MNTGEFIKQKMHNMAAWIESELGSSVDYISIVDARSELELTTLCAMLHTKKEIETHRNWSALVAALDMGSRSDEVAGEQWVHPGA